MIFPVNHLQRLNGNNSIVLTDKINRHLAYLKTAGLYRQRQIINHDFINFSNNDYLSLRDEPRIKQAFQTGFARFSAGSGGSPLVCGYDEQHQALEKDFAAALNVDACLIFSSGYAANLSVMNLLGQFHVHALIDKAIHASLYDGLILSNVHYLRYHHQNLDDLALKMQAIAENGVVITESIFSMSGQISNLHAIAALTQQQDFDLIVDEAHAFGIVGDEGLGAVVAANLSQKEVPLRIIPLGKAFAASGAIVAGDMVWINALLQCARSFIYSTAISPAMCHGLMETLNILRAADDRRKKLADLVAYFRQSTLSLPLQWRDSSSPIQQLQLGCPKQALAYTKYLKQHGIICMPMRQPTVNKMETGLRIVLNYHHQPEDIDRLFYVLNDLKNENNK